MNKNNLRMDEFLQFLKYEFKNVIEFSIGIFLFVIFICGLGYFSYLILISEQTLSLKLLGVALMWMVVYILFYMDKHK